MRNLWNISPIRTETAFNYRLCHPTAFLGALQSSRFPHLLFSVSVYHTSHRASEAFCSARISHPTPSRNALCCFSNPVTCLSTLVPMAISWKPRPIICSSPTHAQQTAQMDEVPPLSGSRLNSGGRFVWWVNSAIVKVLRRRQWSSCWFYGSLWPLLNVL